MIDTKQNWSLLKKWYFITRKFSIYFVTESTSKKITSNVETAPLCLTAVPLDMWYGYEYLWPQTGLVIPVKWLWCPCTGLRVKYRLCMNSELWDQLLNHEGRQKYRKVPPKPELQMVSLHRCKDKSHEWYFDHLGEEEAIPWQKCAGDGKPK